jgi:hypothetical protein
MSPELKRNLELLAGRFPEVFAELQGAGFSAQDFLPSSCYGAVDPDALITRWLRGAPLEPRQVVVTTGFGDGRHVLALLRLLPGSSRVCVLEADAGALMRGMDGLHAGLLLEDRRFILLTPFSYRDGITRLNVELMGVESARLFAFSPLREKHAALYSNFSAMVMRQLSTRWNQLKTDVDHAEVVWSNSLKNLMHFGFGSEVTALRGLFAGRPMILVAAGPSLDSHFDFLRSVQGRAVIAVVNSAYRAVLSEGIRPDLTVAVDPFEGTYKGYSGSDASGVALFCSFLVYPRVPELFPGRVVPLSSYNPFVTLVKQVLRLPEDPGLIGDGTVSSTVVNLAVYLGCTDLYLVGQDMALLPDGQSHTTRSFYGEEGINRVSLEHCQWLPGNEGGPVPVEPRLGAYLKVFENLVSHHAGLRVRNLSRCGVRIHGAAFCSEQEAWDRLRLEEPADFRGLLLERVQRAAYAPAHRDAVILLLTRYRDELRSWLNVLLAFAVRLELATELHGQRWDALDPAHPLRVLHGELRQWITSHPLYFRLLQEGRSKAEFARFAGSEAAWQLVEDAD